MQQTILRFTFKETNLATVAEILVQTLPRAGVKRVYGLPGDSLNEVTDSTRKHKAINWVHVRNGEAAAFAAGAEAHLTDRLAVCAGSCGPGNLHFINGLYDCHRSRVPVLAIASQIPSTELGTAYFQETSPQQLSKNCSHYCGFISEADQMPRILAIAVRTAISERGVALVVLPGNVAAASSKAVAIPLGVLRNKSSVLPAAHALAAASYLLRTAKRITILAGAGWADAPADLIQVAEQLQAPIVHAYRGKKFVEYDDPYDVGMTGLLGFTSGFRAMMHCDPLLVLGSDFPYPQFYPENAKKIQIDIRGDQIGRRTAVDVGLIGSVKEPIVALLPLLGQKKDGAFLKESTEHYQDARKELDELAVGTSGSIPLHPEYVARVLDEISTGDAVFTVDSGLPTIWAARYLHFNGKRRLIGSSSHGSMAGALPEAIGAQATYPARQVNYVWRWRPRDVDGGASDVGAEPLARQSYRLQQQLARLCRSRDDVRRNRPFRPRLSEPEFQQGGRGRGLLGLRGSQPEQLRPALTTAFTHDGPALAEVLVARRELSMPPTITAAQAMGFSLYLSRCVFSGKGDEVIDVAETNLLGKLFRKWHLNAKVEVKIKHRTRTLNFVAHVGEGLFAVESQREHGA